MSSRAWWEAATNKRLRLDVPIRPASHQTRLDTRSKARRPIKVGIKGRSGTNRDSNPACLCCSSAHLVQCEPDETSSFTNPNVGPGTYASLRLKLDAWSSAVQGGGDKGDKNAARPPEGSLVETRCLIKGPKSAIVPFPEPRSGPMSRTGPGASRVPQFQQSKSRKKVQILNVIKLI